ncbi:hypothetical protein K4S71_02170 [Staphylococcus epidermidis]|nr:hypothetical protein [Staphylococcus epidermidis]MCG1262244.1 hypothetical protein [Staphylococcus epidermidis]MCG1302920.1 hypothetical protein [Staphylococcus epidermidis]MCG1385696.1 hypothetical protein [Staphylococcus epidermidis]MCG1502070.1 hypothetical protein [Staphylococcus epidermidis]
MKKIKNSYKIRIKYFLILITLMVIYYWFSKLDNPYIQFYNSETIHYFINTICKQYIHILSFAIQSSLCAFIIAFFIKILFPNKLNIPFDKTKFYFIFIPSVILVYSFIYMCLLAIDDNKILNLISLVGTIVAFFFTTIKIITENTLKDKI